LDRVPTRFITSHKGRIVRYGTASGSELDQEVALD